MLSSSWRQKLGQFLLVLTQTPARRAHQIMHRRIGLAHLLQSLFRWDATVHYPNALGFAVLLFDLFEEVLQGRLVTGIAGQHLIGQRKSLRRDNQRHHYLHTIPTFVPTVAIP